MKQYMIFFRELDLEHYVFNGEWPIAIGPHSLPFGAKDFVTTSEQAIKNTEPHIPLLNEVLGNARKKTFIINKQRYQVIHRAKFLTQ